LNVEVFEAFYFFSPTENFRIFFIIANASFETGYSLADPDATD